MSPPPDPQTVSAPPQPRWFPFPVGTRPARPLRPVAGALPSPPSPCRECSRRQIRFHRPRRSAPAGRHPVSARYGRSWPARDGRRFAALPARPGREKTPQAFGKIVRLGLGRNLHCQAGPPRNLPRLPLDRGGQAQVVQHRRPQQESNIANLVHAGVGQPPDRVQEIPALRIALRNALLEVSGIHQQGVEVRPTSSCSSREMDFLSCS